jgi:hypothetical protein
MMRRTPPTMALPGPIPEERHDWQTIKTLLPYLWAWKGRVVFALTCLLLAKVTSVSVPMVFKDIIDSFTLPGSKLSRRSCWYRWACWRPTARCAFPPCCSPSCARSFSPASPSARCAPSRCRSSSHLHALSLRFHLDRQTGGLTRDIERGTRSIGSLISYTLYSILPTLIEIDGARHPRRSLRQGFTALSRWSFGWCSTSAFTIVVTNWRTDCGARPTNSTRQPTSRADRQPDQLRDGEVLQQRALRTAATTTDAQMEVGPDQEPDLAVLLNIGQS